MGWKLFKGVEVEGKRTGRLTLFVQDVPPDDAIIAVLKKDPYISHIYWGARYKSYDALPSKVSLTQVSYFIYESKISTFDGLIGTIEMNYHSGLVSKFKDFIYEGVEFIFPVQSVSTMVKIMHAIPAFMYPRIQFKVFSTSGVTLIQASSIIHTSSKIYSTLEDRLIKEGT